MRYWLQTEYNYGDFHNKKWALHKVDDKTGEDEIILWKSYDETPGHSECDEDDIEGQWRAVDNYIESELGFMPEYEVN